MEPVFPQLARVGGSHAQREVFEDTLLESYIRAEQYDKAEDLLRERLNRRSSVRDSYWLARTKTNTGDTETAQNTLKMVAQNWQQADPTSPEISYPQNPSQRRLGQSENNNGSKCSYKNAGANLPEDEIQAFANALPSSTLRDRYGTPVLTGIGLNAPSKHSATKCKKPHCPKSPSSTAPTPAANPPSFKPCCSSSSRWKFDYYSAIKI